MKALIGVGIGVFLVLAATMAAQVWMGLSENRELQAELRTLRAELRESREQREQLDESRRLMEERLAAMRDEMRMRGEAAEQAEESEAGRQAEARPPVSPKPYQVPVYLGREFLGHGWVVPSNFTEDSQTGRVGYQPVLHLDEKMRKSFVVHETNVVEREVYRNQSYSYNVYPRPYLYPVVVNRGPPRMTNEPPRQPKPPQPPPPAPPTSRSSSGGNVWMPVQPRAPQQWNTVPRSPTHPIVPFSGTRGVQSPPRERGALTGTFSIGD
ncbi:MAG TPA: hypothetical protein VMS21_09060 [Methylomirabilota bacterium]|nr:hypothetical protein [Methylomirabilota bacterium]